MHGNKGRARLEGYSKKLTAREAEILRLYDARLDMTQIARKLAVKRSSVYTTLTFALNKRTHANMAAAREKPRQMTPLAIARRPDQVMYSTKATGDLTAHFQTFTEEF